MNKPMPPDKDSDFPDYQHKQGWEMPEIPPKPAPTEYAYSKAPEPPKPRCLADDPEHKKEHEKTIIWSAKLWTLVAALSMLVNFGSLILLPDPRIDPKRTDHAVQAGIRECERTLPRTQTCELSQLSFKVVEKK